MGLDIDIYRNWIEIEMTPEMNWNNIEKDHVKPFSMFVISKDEKKEDVFNWKYTQPLLKHDHQRKGTKYDFLHYQLQFTKAYQFIKLNDKRFNDKFHQ